MIFWREAVPAAMGNGGRNPANWNGASGATVPLPPFPVVVGPYRHLPRRLEAIFLQFFWDHYLFSKNREIYIYKSQKEKMRGRAQSETN
jgi:hypothetical protein